MEQQILRWDTRVEEVFADLASGFHREARNVTLEQLLRHRAGLAPNLDWSPYWRAEKTKVQAQRLAATREALTQPPRHAPGTHTEYSNLGYVVVGAMFEKLSGQAWEDLI